MKFILYISECIWSIFLKREKEVISFKNKESHLIQEKGRKSSSNNHDIKGTRQRKTLDKDRNGFGTSLETQLSLPFILRILFPVFNLSSCFLSRLSRETILFSLCSLSLFFELLVLSCVQEFLALNFFDPTPTLPSSDQRKRERETERRRNKMEDAFLALDCFFRYRLSSLSLSLETNEIQEEEKSGFKGEAKE